MKKPWLTLAAAALALTGCATPPKPSNTLFAYAVTSHTCDAVIKGATARGHYCTITINVRNITDTKQKPGIAFAKAVDAQGATYLADAIAQIQADGTGSSFLDDLPPHSEIMSRLVYDLPKDRTLAAVTLREFPSEAETTVSLLSS